ncbi:hypothetical protein ACINWC743_A0734 [Acinetobacter sp. WC-743]|uniref:hypothetical protein n=1 Tax=Acinetobacter sp. WC-743 TaxID=903945 RepID=UPI0002AECBF0|nr:hypothetical protein [Acinetobacter sp. WC-743]ELW85676.1 hypothetical protein ACINWC743_A0734 [Acinetobacter sp. WC-743]
MSNYIPPNGRFVSINLGKKNYTPPKADNLSINLTPDQQSGETQYIGGEGTGWDSFVAGQSKVRLQFRHIQNVGGFESNSIGRPLIYLYSRYIFSQGFKSESIGSPSIINRNRYYYFSGTDFLKFGAPSFQNLKRFLPPIGLNAGLYGNHKVQSLRAYINHYGSNFIKFGDARISYKEQFATNAGGINGLQMGNHLVAYSLRYIEMNSNNMELFGRAWISFSPRYIEPRGIYEQYPSNHLVSPKITIYPEGLNATLFGTRIIPEIQRVYCQGLETIYGNAEVKNYKQFISPKGFLGFGENVLQQWGHYKVWNRTQYIVQKHASDDGLNPPTPSKLATVLNRNRTLQMFGLLHQRFGYQQVENGARALLPLGIQSLTESEKTKTFIAFRIRKLPIPSIEPIQISAWTNVRLGAKLLKPSGILASRFGTAYVENTRRNFRFIGLGVQSIYGNAMVSDAIRTLGFEQRFTIAPPIISLPEVKYGRRFVEFSATDTMSKYGRAEVVSRFNKIFPKYELKNLVGEPIVRNVTPELRHRGLDLSEYGNTYIGLYTRYINAQSISILNFGNHTIADRKQSIIVYGISSPDISKFHKLERIGAGKYITQLIDFDKNGIATENFETDPKKWHVIHQNVIRPDSDKEMTLFGVADVHANSIRVEPGYWERLFGVATISHKNRSINVAAWTEKLDLGAPRISPHTIFAVKEAPEQAINNHVKPELELHYVDGYRREPGAIFGTADVSHFHRKIVVGGGVLTLFGSAELRQTLFIIKPKGFNSLKFGIIAPIGNQTISFRRSLDMSSFGLNSIQHIEPYNKNIKPSGFESLKFSKNEIQLFHRNVFMTGLDSQSMGTLKQDDTPYMWQGLRIGPHIPTDIGCGLQTAYGKAWISNRVRELKPIGLDYALVNVYDYGNFDQRMRVTIRKDEQVIPPQRIYMSGFDGLQIAASDIKNHVYFIRPDGNSDQYRKGAF